MAKVNFSKLGLKTNKDIKTFTYNNAEVEVLQYLDTESKYDLIMIALQKSFENGFYNELLLDMYLHLYIVYFYSNLIFTEKQKENEFKLFDMLNSTDFLEKFIENMDEEEYNFIFNTADSIRGADMRYRTSGAGAINRIVQDLPKTAQDIFDEMANFDPEKYQEVVNFAKSVGYNPEA